MNFNMIKRFSFLIFITGVTLALLPAMSSAQILSRGDLFRSRRAAAFGGH